MSTTTTVAVTPTTPSTITTKSSMERGLDLLKQFVGDDFADKRHIIEVQWFGPTLTSDDVPQIEIVMSSRKIKHADASPPDTLFRTHLYEFRLIPNAAFWDWAGGQKARFHVELKLYIRSGTESEMHKKKKKASSDDEQEEEEEQVELLADGNLFHEYFVCDTPVITYTFLEDIPTKSWIVNLIWPEEKNRFSFKGEFCFGLAVFKKVDDATYRRVWYRTSSCFRVFSKPGVFTAKKKTPAPKPVKSKKKRGKKQADDMDEEHNDTIKSEDTIDKARPKRKYTKKRKLEQLQQAEEPNDAENGAEEGNHNLDTTVADEPPAKKLILDSEAQQMQQQQLYNNSSMPSFFTASMEAAVAQDPEDMVIKSPRTSISVQNLMSPTSPFFLGTPRGLLSLSFSQNTNTTFESQPSASQKFDNLFMAATNYPFLGDDADDDNFYNRHLDKQ